jgi:hypothetical protein
VRGELDVNFKSHDQAIRRLIHGYAAIVIELIRSAKGCSTGCQPVIVFRVLNRLAAYSTNNFTVYPRSKAKKTAWQSAAKTIRIAVTGS